MRVAAHVPKLPAESTEVSTTAFMTNAAPNGPARRILGFARGDADEFGALEREADHHRHADQRGEGRIAYRPISDTTALASANEAQQPSGSRCYPHTVSAKPNSGCADQKGHHTGLWHTKFSSVYETFGSSLA
ncbi:hypothetical protein PHO31112_04040 [Pandoraea horticolens]|uniref:Uncharacterized protein n=1 Tax=Pandoraea horticolens TaxID=2508298 RepID=A0A5E4XS48_9BURK|nr:hypothetical protein PHO31112_04040 [Pandoraea horticolens]